MEKIVGLIDAPFTPFDEQGEVNLEPIEAYARMLVKNGLKGVFINGSSGEGYMLTEEERMRLAEEWVRVAPAGFKVIVHVGSCCVKESKRLAEHAQKLGAWGIGAMAPPFPKIGRIEELVKYCEEIAAGAPQLPFYYYHIPAFNGAYLPMTSFLEAVDGRIPNFAGIKYTYESIYEYNQCRLYKNGKYDMLHGLVADPQPNPKCVESGKRLEELYAQALPLAETLILEFVAKLDTDEPLDKAYDHTFGEF